MGAPHQRPEEQALESIQSEIYGNELTPLIGINQVTLRSYTPEQLIPGILQVDAYIPRLNQEGLWKRVDDIPATDGLMLVKESEMQLSFARYLDSWSGRVQSGRLVSEIRDALQEVYRSYAERYPPEVVDRLRKEDENLALERSAFWVFSDPVDHKRKFVIRSFNGAPDLLSLLNPPGWNRAGAKLMLENAHPEVMLPERIKFKMMANVVELGRLTEEMHLLNAVELAFGRVAEHLTNDSMEAVEQNRLMIYAECYPAVARLFTSRYGFELAEDVVQPSQTRIIRISGEMFFNRYHRAGWVPPSTEFSEIRDDQEPLIAPRISLTRSDRAMILQAEADQLDLEIFFDLKTRVRRGAGEVAVAEAQISLGKMQAQVRSWLTQYQLTSSALEGTLRELKVDLRILDEIIEERFSSSRSFQRLRKRNQELRKELLWLRSQGISS